jgi:hypothetical protein
MSHSLSKSTKRRRVLQEIDEILPSFDTVCHELEVEQLMQFNTPDPVDKDSELNDVDNNIDMSVVEEQNQLLEGITQ